MRKILLALALVPGLASAGDFVTNPTNDLYPDKAQGVLCPYAVSNPAKCWRSTDANAVKGALKDLRDQASALRITATGSSTSRTLAARAADVVNVKDHGAKADTTTGLDGTDDGPFVQAAINALPSIGGTIFIPPGKYRIAKRTWTFPAAPAAVRIVGAGRGATRLYFSGMTATDWAFDIAGTAYLTDERRVQMEHLWIDPGGGRGVRLGPYTYYHSGISDVEMHDGSIAFEVDGTYGTFLRGLMASGVNTGVGYHITGGANTIDFVQPQVWDGALIAALLIDGGAGGFAVSTPVLQGWSTPESGACVRLDGAADVVFTDAHLEASGNSYKSAAQVNASTNIHFTGTTTGGQFTGPMIELTDSTGVVIERTNVQGGSDTHQFLTQTGGTPAVLRDNTGSSYALNNLAGLSLGTKMQGPFAFGFGAAAYTAYNTDLDGRNGTDIEFTLTAASVKFNNIWATATGTGQRPGEVLTVRVMNTTGSAASVDFGTGGNLRAGPSQSIAAGMNRTFEFKSNGTRWYEATRSPADVAN